MKTRLNALFSCVVGFPVEQSKFVHHCKDKELPYQDFVGNSSNKGNRERTCSPCDSISSKKHGKKSNRSKEKVKQGNSIPHEIPCCKEISSKLSD